MTELVPVRDLGEDGRAEVCRLLMCCFCDTSEYVSALLEAAEDERFCFVLDAGRRVGGAFLFDVNLFPGGGACARRGIYIFALGVLPESRGLGLSREILEAAKAVSDDFTLIVSADERLSAYYARCGFNRFLPGTAPCGSRGIEPDAACVRFSKPGGYVEAVRAAHRHGGVLLAEPLFSFSLSDADAVLRFCGDAYIAVGEGRLLAACGLTLQNPVLHKAQFCEKRPLGDLAANFYADLLLEY